MNEPIDNRKTVKMEISVTDELAEGAALNASTDLEKFRVMLGAMEIDFEDFAREDDGVISNAQIARCIFLQSLFFDEDGAFIGKD